MLVMARTVLGQLAVTNSNSLLASRDQSIICSRSMYSLAKTNRVWVMGRGRCGSRPARRSSIGTWFFSGARTRTAYHPVHCGMSTVSQTVKASRHCLSRASPWM